MIAQRRRHRRMVKNCDAKHPGSTFWVVRGREWGVFIGAFMLAEKVTSPGNLIVFVWRCCWKRLRQVHRQRNLSATVNRTQREKQKGQNRKGSFPGTAAEVPEMKYISRLTLLVCFRSVSKDNNTGARWRLSNPGQANAGGFHRIFPGECTCTQWCYSACLPNVFVLGSQPGGDAGEGFSLKQTVEREKRAAKFGRQTRKGMKHARFVRKRERERE